MTYTPGCWFAANVIGSGPCDGQLVRCHLIRKSTLKMEARSRKRWPLKGDAAWPPTDEVIADPRCWVWGCGGPTGIGGHHGQLDQSRKLRIPREILPPEVEEFAAELGLEWWLDREYGPLQEAA